ncbi:MAG: hypothetical protein R3F35_14750 [Myxococcota bacterium]
MMLRNAAAALPTLSFSLFLAFAPAALALDAIDLSEPQAAPAPGECPPLVRIKYPFLSCVSAAEGHELLQARPVRVEPSWSNVRQIPLMSVWTESDGAWGPDLNQD